MKVAVSSIGLSQKDLTTTFKLQVFAIDEATLVPGHVAALRGETGPSAIVRVVGTDEEKQTARVYNAGREPEFFEVKPEDLERVVGVFDVYTWGNAHVTDDALNAAVFCKVTITRRALVQRLQRSLAKSGEKLHATRQWTTNLGSFYTTDANGNVDAYPLEYDDLVKLGRELGVLKQHEVVEGLEIPRTRVAIPLPSSAESLAQYQANINRLLEAEREKP